SFLKPLWRENLFVNMVVRRSCFLDHIVGVFGSRILKFQMLWNCLPFGISSKIVKLIERVLVGTQKKLLVAHTHFVIQHLNRETSSTWVIRSVTLYRTCPPT